MKEPHLHILNGCAEMMTGARIVSTARLSELRKLYIAMHESPLYQGDEAIYVAEFPDFLWVIPEFTPGLDRFLQAIAQVFERKSLIYRTVTPPIPRAWRKKLLGFIPLFPVPSLSQQPLSSLPAWQEKGPYHPRELIEFARSDNSSM